MKNKNKEPEENKYSVTQKLGVLNNLQNQYISLNTKRATYFGVKKAKANSWTLWLSPSHPYAMVPDSLSFDEMEQIRKGLDNKIIVPGKVLIPIVDQDKNIKAKYVNLIKKANSLDPITKKQFVELVKKNKEGGFTAIQILTDVLATERTTRNRSEFVRFLEDGISYCTGPVSLVEDSFEEESDEQAIERKANDPDYQKPVNITSAVPLKGDPKTREALLNRYLS